MSLIRAVENRLGSIDTWPTHITEYLFCDVPALSTLEELIAFFFGSGIPCPMACQLYHACNGRVTAYVTEHFYTTYSFWDSCTYEVHLASYYNMSIQKYVYINGSLRNPCELVLTQIGYVRIGIDNAPFPHLIRVVLECIRATVNYY